MVSYDKEAERYLKTELEYSLDQGLSDLGT